MAVVRLLRLFQPRPAEEVVQRLSPPGGDEELRNLVARVMSRQLDRGKPVWEM
jgi:hypothetical protein